MYVRWISSGWRFALLDILLKFASITNYFVIFMIRKIRRFNYELSCLKICYHGCISTIIR